MLKITKLWNKFKSYLNLDWFTLFIHIYQLIFAVILISGLIYVRFLPRISQELWVVMNNYQILTTLVKIGLICANSYLILVLMGLINIKNKYFFMERVKHNLTTVIDYIKNILINFYEFIWYITEEFVFLLTKQDLFHYHVFRYISIYLLNPVRQKLLGVILFGLNLIPKLLFVLVFSYDVCIQHYLHYTFLFLPFLLIPLLEQFFLFMFNHFYALYWKKTLKYLKISEKKTNNGIRITHEFLPEYADPENIPYKYKDFHDYYDNHLMVFVKLDIALSEYTEWKYAKCFYYAILLAINIIRLFLLFILLIYGII